MARATRPPEETPPAEHAEAAERRAAAASDPNPVPPGVRQLLDALARERAGYVARGLDDRVALVDEQIKKVEG